MILLFISNLVFLLIGLVVGYFMRDDVIEEGRRYAREIQKKIDNPYVGPVNRPSKEKLERKDTPEAEAEEEVEKFFDQVLENE